MVKSKKEKDAPKENEVALIENKEAKETTTISDKPLPENKVDEKTPSDLVEKPEIVDNKESEEELIERKNIDDFERLCKALVDFRVENMNGTQRVGMATSIEVIGISFMPNPKKQNGKFEINLRLENGELIRTSDLDLLLNTLEKYKEKLAKIQKAINSVNETSKTEKLKVDSK